MVVAEIGLYAVRQANLAVFAVQTASLGVVILILSGLLVLLWVDVLAYLYVVCKANAGESSLTFVATTQEQVSVMLLLKQYMATAYSRLIAGARPGVVRLLKRNDDK